MQNAEQMPLSWGLGAARWDWLPGVQEAPLLPCPEEPGPLDCNHRAQLLPQFTLQAGWAEARGLWDDLRRRVAPLGRHPLGMGSSRLLPLTSDVG